MESLNSTKVISHNYFISDLHLGNQHFANNEVFLEFCGEIKKKVTLSQTQPTKIKFRLFILGDLLELAIADRVPNWFTEQQNSLRSLAELGVEIFFMVGNRDFLLAENFCQQTGMYLLPENTVVDFSLGKDKLNFRVLNTNKDNLTLSPVSFGNRVPTTASTSLEINPENCFSILLCHGDNLCRSDLGYLRYRKVIRSAFVVGLAKLLPESFKDKISQYLRKNSQTKQKQTSKSDNQKVIRKNIYDIDLPYLQQLTDKAQASMAIFGHVHKQRLLQATDSGYIAHKQLTRLADLEANNPEVVAVRLNRSLNFNEIANHDLLTNRIYTQFVEPITLNNQLAQQSKPLLISMADWQEQSISVLHLCQTETGFSLQGYNQVNEVRAMSRDFIL